MVNGIGLGVFLIMLGAVISYYTGMLLVKAGVYSGKNRFEDIADKLYGRRCKQATNVLNLLCLCGFIMSYIVYVKSMLPNILLLFWTEE
jgi:amino acid permease